MDRITPKEKSTVKGIAWLTLSTVILKVIGLIYKIPISYLLGDEGMGYFNSAYTVYTFFFIICSSGIPKGISIIVSKYEAEKNKRADSFYKSSLIILGIFGSVAAIIFFLLAPIFTRIISSYGSLYSMLAVAPSLAFVCMSGVARGYLVGKMKFSHVAISEIIIGACKLFVGLGFAHVGIRLSLDTPFICALSILGISVGTFISSMYLVFICGKSVKVAPIKITREEISDLAKISLPITFASVGTAFMGVLDLLLIIRGLSTNDYSEGVANALYGNYSTLTLPMISLVSTLIMPIITTYTPILTKKYASGKIKEYTEKFNESLSLVLFIALPCFLVFMLYSKKLLGIIFEQGSVTLGYALLTAASPGVLFLALATVINNALESTGKVRIPVISMATAAIAKVIFMLMFMRYTDLGILSAPLCTAISYGASFLVSYSGFRRVSGNRVKLFGALYLPLVASLFGICSSTVTEFLLKDIGSERIKSIIILSVFAFVYFAFMLILSKKTRDFVLKMHKMNKKK